MGAVVRGYRAVLPVVMASRALLEDYARPMDARLATKESAFSSPSDFTQTVLTQNASDLDRAIGCKPHAGAAISGNLMTRTACAGMNRAWHTADF
jgi:hypothetical protein